ncbi:hypothetical protein [Candidatus Parabeggiatoa sp. HSG14]|uniref:hypothetical protein n=1 Tax=Candidatus Parabeggiatoa sp. HSG14 TaxID=3055593 RepID=UPI0025A6E0E9|nr:hypothetical protein [Thiotrichales bacterium HSG14]
MQLVEILQDEVLEDISPLEHHKMYWIWTPINSYGAAETLMNAMQEMEFDVCFFRSQSKFEIKTKSLGH